MATLELINLSKKYGKKVWGAKNVNIEVNDKEFIVFLGPSGCGKTTTLRMIAGLEDVTEGKILLDKEEITYEEPRKRNISMVFQSYAVWPHMTVYENIAFPLKLKNKNKDEMDTTVKRVAEMTSIAEYLERYPKQLSGGQRQRVALARALAVNPKIFLMDEPLSNLDAKLRVRMRTELKAIHHKTEATTVFVTHDQSEAMSMADRIVIMKDGSIEQIGSTDEVYFDSANMFVAGFIGTPPTNFMDMEIKRKNGKIVLTNPEFEYPMDEKYEQILKNYDKNKLILGIRPESISINEGNEIIKTKIDVIEPQGSHQIIAITLNNKIVKISAPTFPKYNLNENISLSFNENRVLLFDVETKERIK